jgi:hypothetical protein
MFCALMPSGVQACIRFILYDAQVGDSRTAGVECIVLCHTQVRHVSNIVHGSRTRPHEDSGRGLRHYLDVS